MDHLYTPWRYQFISSIKDGQACIFCLEDEARSDRERLLLFRGAHNFVLLNLYPYTNGHLMIAPYAHIADLEQVPTETLAEMMELIKVAKHGLNEIYHPNGFNIGMNLGKCAGAGVEGHLHLHVVPRWIGDASFMSIIGETRILPEELMTTYDKLLPFFASK